MLHKKNLTTIAIVILMCFLVTQTALVSYAASSDKPSIIVDSVEGRIGDTVDVAITVSNNPGFVSANLYVNYDTDVLKLTGVKDGGLLPGVTHSDNYTSPYGLCWVNDLSTKNFTANGVLATLTFEILKFKKSESSTISLEQDILDCDVENVVFSLESGQVKISSSSEENNTLNSDSENLSGSVANTADTGEEHQESPSSLTQGSSAVQAQESASAEPNSSDQNSNRDETDDSADSAANAEVSSVLESTQSTGDEAKSTTSQAGRAIDYLPVWIIFAIVLVASVSAVGYIYYKHKKKR